MGLLADLGTHTASNVRDVPDESEEYVFDDYGLQWEDTLLRNMEAMHADATPTERERSYLDLLRWQRDCAMTEARMALAEFGPGAFVSQLVYEARAIGRQLVAARRRITAAA